jgi:hypothetical protein
MGATVPRCPVEQEQQQRCSVGRRYHSERAVAALRELRAFRHSSGRNARSSLAAKSSFHQRVLHSRAIETG